MKDKMPRKYYLIAPFTLAFIVLIISFSLFYVNLADVEHLLIIHFESLRGVDFLGSKNEALGILLSGLAIGLINFFLASFIFNRNRLYSYLISILTIFISVLILITIIVIISVN